MTESPVPAAPVRRGRRPKLGWAGLRMEDIGPGPRAARTKITRLLAAALIALLLLMVTSTVTLMLMRHRVSNLANEIEPESAANRGARLALSDAQAGVKGYLWTRQTIFLNDYRSAVVVLSEQLDLLQQQSANDEQLARLVSDQRSAVETWQRDYVTLVTGGQITAADTAAVARGTAAYAKVVTANEAVINDLQERSRSAVVQSRALTAGASAGILLIGAVGVFMVLRPGLRALRFIGPPLESLYRTVRELRAGRLDARADSTRGVIEIRAVALAVNELAASNQRQRELLSERLRLSEFVRELSRDMKASLEFGEVIDATVKPVADQFGTSSTWIRAWDGTSELPGPGRRVQYPTDHDLDSPTFLISCARRIAILAWERQITYVLGAGSPRDSDFISQADHDAMLSFVGQVGVSSMIMVPVGDGGDCFGYLALARPAGAKAWNIVEQDALLQIGRELGRSIRHARILTREHELVAELQALDIKKRDFVSMVSHELRTPLSSIIGHLELVRSGDLGDVADDMEISLNAMMRNSSRLTRLIEDLLLITRIEERTEPAVLVPLDLSELSKDVIQLHAEAAQQKSITVSLQAPAPVPVLGDPDEVDRVISNLLGNAIKYSPVDTDVVITVIGDVEVAALSVTDHGMGISAGDQEQLFTRFFRSTNPAALRVPGTGLGLAITKLIIDKHQGTLALDSTEGVGSTFTVTLPSAAAMQTRLDEAAMAEVEQVVWA